MPTHRYTSRAQVNARRLRREMTPPERHLWYDFLKDLRPRFARQRPIGPYIVDFVCQRARLVLEIDGVQHYEKESYAYDEARTRYLEGQGLRVLRLLARDIERDFAATCALIERAVEDASIKGRLQH